MKDKHRLRMTSILLDYETDEYLEQMVGTDGMGPFIRLLIKQEYKRRQGGSNGHPTGGDAGADSSAVVGQGEATCTR